MKIDPELGQHMSPRSNERKKYLLELGLSDYYVALCFDAYRADRVSAQRLIEMLLLDSENELVEFADLYGERLRHAS